MKKVLGLDLGTNSIGWALVEQDFENKQGNILGMGSRIIPMSQDIKDEFGKGNSISQTADRTKFRGVRRLRERHLLRRERLHRTLNVLGFLPEHYSSQIDFEHRLGKFLEEKEPKLVYDNKDFIFKKSFEEMLEDFRQHQPGLLNRKNKKGDDAKIPYDWTIYYLRKKALTQIIEKEELAWIILNFNQKRGYYQLRGEEEEENPNKSVKFYSLKIMDVTADEKPNAKGETWYSLHLEKGWIYRRASKTPLFDWKDKVRDFIVTTDLNDDGTVKTDKEGAEKRSFRAPGEEDWTLIKKKTEQEIDKSDKTAGAYIYDTLLLHPSQKIKGKLVQTIERKFYKEELKAILKKQIELQPKLFTNDLYNDCIRELYRNNEAHQTTLSQKDFVHLFVEDIIFYQRPLRSQKSSIGNCSLEFRKYKDENGIEKTEYLKAIPKSHPLYQEFRLWQWLYNLKIYKKEDDSDVTGQFIKEKEELVNLFDFLMSQREVDHKDIIKHLLVSSQVKGKALNAEIAKYRWNYVYDTVKDESKKYPCNETGYEIRRRLSKVEKVPADFLTPKIEQRLWHLIYSIRDKIEFEKALKSFANEHKLDEASFVENFRKFPPFKSEYGSFSEKAIKKLLPLMRIGKYWNWDKIDNKTKNRISKIITGEYDEEMKNRVREKAVHLTEEEDFQGLPLWLAQYIVYDRHSEAGIAGKWNSVADLEKYLEEFKQHSLRNPIVEQVVTETLRVVKDIWEQYGNGSKDFFKEIHIELGREMKNTAEDRKRITNQITENENTNLRIKALLTELLNDSNVENVRPFSPIQQEALKIYEDGVLNSDVEVPEDILKISKTAQPAKSELQRYKLWLEQKYRSPYTGEIIPLNKLFTSEYEIEHIIPQARYFDDSFSNKVICESAINKLKDKQLGFEFIKNYHGTTIETGFGRTVKVFEEEAYQEFVKGHYAKNRSKKTKLLLDEIPDKMIERQMNDTRYISKFISNILSNIVREDKNDDGLNSKNVLPGNGKITSTLKQDWGLNDVWNDLILPRFERMNQLTNSKVFTVWNENYQKFLPAIPLEYSKGFSKKRIDHRHHALDALVIACATRDHVNLLNNQSAKSESKRFDLQNKLRRKEPYFNQKENRQKEAFKEFLKPWDNFTLDAREALEKIVVSFKQNLRVINKTTNKYEKLVEKNGKISKELVPQIKGDSWAIRKPMHKDFVYGTVDLPRVKLGKGKFITAIRKTLDTTFDEKRIESITDTGIQKILINHLEKYKRRLDERGDEIPPESLAFTPLGIEDMNKNIKVLNGGKFHQPIYKVRVFEIGSRFALGQTSNKKTKYVEAKDGTNLYFAIYIDEKENRNFESIPLNIIIERQKQGENSVPEKKVIEDKGQKKELNLFFHLSPNDLIYIPTVEERETLLRIDFSNLTKEQMKRIYNVNDFSTTCYFKPNYIAKAIVPKEVDMNYNKQKNKITGSYDTKTASFDGEQIKDICIKLKVDRLGNISKA
ncbi:type II CRISPR RNA-guided endonuclease Cas9 [Rubrolithibacter danxiaensis]|uniref:type II CRISPR RNA-guided endonuclease Cas9 n=1 Tax=Rubrolithibacter danxiaensis TaxID=3390805 RepID=UPI003BF913C0